MREYYSTQLAVVVGVLLLVVSAAFAFKQSPELLEHRKAAQRVAMELPHPLAGMENCFDCHGPQSDWPYPPRHTGWSDHSCVRCHQAPE